MADTITIARSTGEFEEDRWEIYDQFKSTGFDPDSGLDSMHVEKLVENYLAKNPGMSRVLKKAHTFRIVLENCRLRANGREWFAGEFEHAGILLRQRERWYAEVEEGPLKEEARWFNAAYDSGTLRGRLDFNHIAPGWENLFEQGLSGLRTRAMAKLEHDVSLDAKQIDFLEAVVVVCNAAVTLAGRIAAYLRDLKSAGAAYPDRLEGIAGLFENIPGHRPGSLHAALQAMWFTQLLVEAEGESAMSFGHFDRMLLPYYQADLDSGRLTEKEAKELLKYFWFRFHCRKRGEGDSARNFTLAGQDRSGADAVNDFTYLALDAVEELNTPDPKVSIRFFAESPDRLYKRVAELIQRGRTSLVLMNDEPSIEGLIRCGKTVEDARTYLSIGCYEPAVDGKDMACTMNIPVNLAKGVELALSDGVDQGTGARLGASTGDPKAFATYRQVEEAYKRQMDHLLETSHTYLTRYEKYWSDINPSPFIAATLDDCIDTARDIGDGGCTYNSVGCPAGALGDVADSLLAIKKAVFDKELYSMAEIVEAVANNYDGYEPMRQYMQNNVAKWGNGDEEVDTLAKEIADYYCGKISSFTTSRGGPYQAGLFSLRFQWFFGQRTAALPSGRLAGTPTAPGIAASAGQDANGITALMGSIETLDFAKAPDGSVLDIMLHPSTIGGDNGLQTIQALIQTHFQKGGNYLQFNVVDTDTLLDAQKNPARHSGLQVRITGYSAYFTKIPVYQQNLFIERIKHAV